MSTELLLQQNPTTLPFAEMQVSEAEMQERIRDSVYRGSQEALQPLQTGSTAENAEAIEFSHPGMAELFSVFDNYRFTMGVLSQATEERFEHMVDKTLDTKRRHKQRSNALGPIKGMTFYMKNNEPQPTHIENHISENYAIAA